MAMESQGILIRRQSTTAGSTGFTSSSAVSFSTARQILRSDAGDFAADGFTTAMRVESNSTINAGVYTIASVAATVITVFEPTSAESTGANPLTLTGHAFQTIGEVVSFTGPSGSAAVIDITNLQSTAKEKMMGLRDEGQLSMEVNLNTSAGSLQPALMNDRANRSLRQFDIVLTDKNAGTTAQNSALFMSGYVTGFAISGAVDAVVKATLTVEITSSVKWIAKTTT